MSTMNTFDFTLRYQHTPCARYHVRPLTLLQQDVVHGLVKTLPPEPWLFDPIPHKKPSRPAEPPRGRIRRCWVTLARSS